MNTRCFEIPTEILFGPGCIKRLKEHLPKQYNRILIVADEPAWQQSQARSILAEELSTRVVSIYADVVENPPLESLEEARVMAIALGAEAVIGVGGGSAMDLAKGVAVAATNDRPMAEYLAGRPLAVAPLPVICIPTTSGTGSEVTPYAVFTNRQSKEVLCSPELFPKLAIVDPELTYSMPHSLIVDTGLDALSHAIEAYLSKGARPISDAVALEAIRLIIEHLPAATRHEQRAMDEMARAAMLAGVAIAHVSAILLHVMGYPLTVFHGIPHGRANGILLPAFLSFANEHTADQVKLATVEALFEGVGGARTFVNRLGVSTSLKDYNVRVDELVQYIGHTTFDPESTRASMRSTRGDMLEIYTRAIGDGNGAGHAGVWC